MFGISHYGVFCTLRGSSASKKGNLLYGNATIVMKEWLFPQIIKTFMDRYWKLTPNHLIQIQKLSASDPLFLFSIIPPFHATA
jgi:hypothetical protein